MKIVIATTSVPFVRGGAEIHAEALLAALREAGHEAEIVAVPFKWYPPETILDHMLACRLLDLTEASGNKIDLVIGLKFPAYFVPHPNKVLWILHQHRQAYDLWGKPLGDMDRFENGGEIRDAIHCADRELISESKAVFANSANVAKRLRDYCGINAEPLYHPPHGAEMFYSGQAEDYFYYPSRFVAPKRQSLVIQALAETRNPVRVEFSGNADYPAYRSELESLALTLGVSDRVRWLGHVNEDEKRDRYARSLGVVYVPVDEDFGYVTLEAMLASKPAVTCRDSGGPLEFVRHRETGLVVESSPAQVAAAMDEIWEDRESAAGWGRRGRELYDSLGITWPKVIERLVA